MLAGTVIDPLPPQWKPESGVRYDALARARTIALMRNNDSIGDPEPGRTYRTGAEGGNFGAPKLQLFRCSTNHRTNKFLRVFVKNYSVELVRRHNFSPTDCPLSFTRARFLSGILCFRAEFMCRFRTRSRMFAFGWFALAWEWLETTLGVLGLSFDGGIS